MIYVEPFSDNPIENVCSTLAKAPDKVIFLGYDEEKLEKFCETCHSIFGINGDNQRVFTYLHIREKTVNDDVKVNEDVKVNDVVKVIEEELSKEEYQELAFDLTGGEEKLIFALGIVYNHLKDSKNIELHKFDIDDGKIIDYDGNNITVSDDFPTIKIVDYIKLFNGVITQNSDIKLDDKDNKSYNSIQKIWQIRCNAGKYWNNLISLLSKLPTKKDDGLKREIKGGENVKSVLSEIRITKKDMMALCAIDDNVKSFEAKKLNLVKYLLSELQTINAVDEFCVSEKSISVKFSNDHLLRMLTNPGRILEYKIYADTAAAENSPEIYADTATAENSPEIYTYVDFMTGAVIDWDGSPKEGTSNEIDVLLMKGLTPVFVSCKNGESNKYSERYEDELYKLNSVANRFGGKYSRKAFVIYDFSVFNDEGENIKNRASDLGIKVIEMKNISEKDYLTAISNLWKK